MNLNLHIANKIRKGDVGGAKLSKPIILVATTGVVLGTMVMIISMAIGTGFKKEIRNKVIGFGSHIQVINYDYNTSFETNPIKEDSSLYHNLKNITGVKHIRKFATKPGLIKTKNDIQGIIIKGFGDDYNVDSFKDILIKGEIPDVTKNKKSNKILISKTLAKLLNLKIGDNLHVYFFQNNIRARKFIISGIYDSKMPEFDKMFLFADIRHIQKLNNWDNNQITGYEILLNDFDNIDNIHDDVELMTSSFINDKGGMLRTLSIKQLQSQIFGWLSLLDMNVAIIIILIVLVAGFNMVSGLLIIILERTTMIGILKSLGELNVNIRKVFLYVASFVVIKGMIIGNIIGLVLCLLQKHFSFISLNPENYYLSSVPISLSPISILLMNIATLVVCYLMMLAPSYLVTKITPTEALRYE